VQDDLEISHNLPFKPSLSKTKSHGPGTLFENLTTAAQTKKREKDEEKVKV
jgi:hypothetical protein